MNDSTLQVNDEKMFQLSIKWMWEMSVSMRLNSRKGKVLLGVSLSIKNTSNQNENRFSRRTHDWMRKERKSVIKWNYFASLEWFDFSFYDVFMEIWNFFTHIDKINEVEAWENRRRWSTFKWMMWNFLPFPNVISKSKTPIMTFNEITILIYLEHAISCCSQGII